VSITRRNRNSYNSLYQAIHLDQISAVKIYRTEVCVFLFIKTCISAKLIFHITVKNRIWKSAPLNKRLNKSSELIILSLYKAPTRDFNQFIKDLNNAVKHQYTPTADLLICGDIKHRLSQWKKKKTPSLTINNINLSHTLNCGTRIQTNSCTAIDNTHVDTVE